MMIEFVGYLATLSMKEFSQEQLGSKTFVTWKDYLNKRIPRRQQHKVFKRWSYDTGESKETGNLSHTD